MPARGPPASAPLGWFSMNPSEHTRELLMEEGGFVYDCDSFADDLPYFVEVTGRRGLVIPYDLVNNDGPYTPSAWVLRAGGLLQSAKGGFRLPVRRGRFPPQDDVCGTPYAPVGQTR